MGTGRPRKNDKPPNPEKKLTKRRQLTAKEREEATIYYYSHKITQAELGELYGVNVSTINKIIHNPKWLAKARMYLDGEMDKADIRKKIAQQKAIEAAPDAIDQLIKIASQEVTKENMHLQYVIQNACVEILNRAGIKMQDSDSNEIVIRFADPAAAFEPGIPQLDEPDMIDVTNSVPGGDAT